ncbi:hypothetical protein PLESTB_000971400 [Pleodorina starrii]|uniref:ShKT domain-containing protein n=1 Tax=Pleodorina starrii TaxID=330485 RepID=A0A9W6BNN4_9CHLO|nr:hypothetical protein PLESTB_000971400 [Pleodorina starrii]
MPSGRSRDRPLRTAGRSLARSCILVAIAVVAIVNVIYIVPVKLGSSPRRATPAGDAHHPTHRAHGRKELAQIRALLGNDLPRLAVHLHCADQSPACEQQRRSGRCSTHLLDGEFHTCLASCGVCPALELALRRSMNLTEGQLVVVRQPGPPRCVDDAAWCGQVAEGQCASGPAQLAGVCKATCGACLQPEAVPEAPAASAASAAAAAGPAARSGGGSSSATGAAGAGGCFDAADMCAWWSRSDPRVCQRAAEDLQAWWWVAVVCRRSCGLCGGGGTAAGGGGGGGGGVGAGAGAAAAATAVTAALVSAARLGVQVGEAPDGSPAVAVFEALPDESGGCTDTQPQCASWASSGECGRNPGFMARSCPASCGSCPVLVNMRQPLARVRLNNGVLQPTVGYGCAGLGDLTSTTVRWALEAGYRHLDSAQAREWYREDLVGQAMSDFLGAAKARGNVTAGVEVVRREDIFVTSKLHPRHLGYHTTLKQFNATLRDLRSPFVDLFLLHYAECWGDLCGGAQPEGDFLDSWRALEEMYGAGLARAIGVSNFSPDQLARLLAAARVRPAVLQVHVDPLGRSEAEQALCRREGITLTAYSTLGTQWGLAGGGNPVLSHPVLQAIGREQGLVVLPRSSNQARMRQNLQLYDWGLTEGHMRQIAYLRPVA